MANLIERLEEWAPHATPAEQWRLDRDDDGCPDDLYADVARGAEVMCVGLPRGEDVEYLFALLQAGPSLLKLARAAGTFAHCRRELCSTCGQPFRASVRSATARHSRCARDRRR